MSSDSNVEDLQAVSRHVLTGAERITMLETEKRTVNPASKRFRTLSNQIEALAEEVRQVSHAETSLAFEVADEHGLPTIDEADQQS